MRSIVTWTTGRESERCAGREASARADIGVWTIRDASRGSTGGVLTGALDARSTGTADTDATMFAAAATTSLLTGWSTSMPRAPGGA
jgi:hypothetical protein